MPDIQRFKGIWDIFGDGTQYDGEIIINEEKKSIKLEIIVHGNIQEQSVKFYQCRLIRYISGKLFDNRPILLYRCSIFPGSYHKSFDYQYVEYSIFAEYGFCGLEIQGAKDPHFEEVMIRMGDLVHWSGLCKYESNWVDQYTPQIKWISKKPVSFDLNNNVEVLFSPFISNGSFNSTKKEVILGQYIAIILKYKIGACWDEIIEDINCVRYFIELGIGTLMGIDSISYLHKIKIEEDDLEPQLIPQVDSIWLGNRDNTPTYEEERFFYTYTLSECIEYNMFSKWTTIYEKLRPILDLYFAAYRYNAFVPETVFLNLMQALETYHARFISDDLRSFLQHVDLEVNNFYGDNSNAEKWKKYIADDNQRNPKCKDIYLRSRLTDLFFAEGDLAHVNYWNGRQGDFVEKLVITRNYYTHYDIKKQTKAFTKEELPLINNILSSFLTFHVLTRMGYNREKAKTITIRELDNVRFIFNESMQYKEES